MRGCGATLERRSSQAVFTAGLGAQSATGDRACMPWAHGGGDTTCAPPQAAGLGWPSPAMDPARSDLSPDPGAERTRRTGTRIAHKTGRDDAVRLSGAGRARPCSLPG